MDSNVVAFARAAEEFCAFLEGQESIPSGTFARRCGDLLATLFKYAIALPYVPAQVEGTVETGVSCDSHAGISEKVTQHFRIQYYRMVVDPLELEQTDFEIGDVGDDVAEIYKEIKEGLCAYTRGTASDINTAVWHWKYTFEHHWGEHLVDAIRVVYLVIKSKSQWA